MLGKLLPFRLLFLTLHLATVISYYFLKVECIQVTLPPVSKWDSQRDIDNKYRAARDRVDLVLSWSYACFFFEYLCLWTALSLNWPRATLFNSATHGIGALLALQSQLDAWSYVTAEYNFVLFTLAPVVVESCIVVGSGRLLYLEHQAPTMMKRAPTAEGSWAYARCARLGALTAAFFGLALGLPLLGVGASRSRRKGTRLAAFAYAGICLAILGVFAVVGAVYVHVTYIDPRGPAVPIEKARPLVQRGRSREDALDSDDEAESP
ncbi:transmembrane protein-domain-containing protein [Pelagophyceae sp. CCMP2097]|nr:transmembrane protein-domain-containing protein [Pelagophyceae sp. CCMP2097]